MVVRQAILQVHTDLLPRLGQGTFRVESHPLPDSIKIISAQCIDRIVHLVLEHESFPETKEGERLPILTPPSIIRLDHKERADG